MELETQTTTNKSQTATVDIVAAAASPCLSPSPCLSHHNSSSPRLSHQPPHNEQLAFGLTPVQATTDDALISKQSAVVAGYFTDPYIGFICSAPQRRQPLINRGYYARVVAIRNALLEFMKCCHEAGHNYQIVNIGAGFDSLGFWILDEAKKLAKSSLSGIGNGLRVKYVELDFEEVLQRKSARILSQTDLVDALKEWHVHKDDRGLMQSDYWKLVGCDFRDLSEHEGPPSIKNVVGLLSSQVPTLYLIECVLGYLSTPVADTVIRWCANLVPDAPCCLMNFDPFNPSDRFGDMMLTNLRSRGCPLLSITSYPTLESLWLRFRREGWSAVSIANMNTVYDHHLDKVDVLRIEHLELFDELEEWRLMQAHYYMAVALLAPMSQRFTIPTLPFSQLAMPPSRGSATTTTQDYHNTDATLLPTPGFPGSSSSSSTNHQRSRASTDENLTQASPESLIRMEMTKLTDRDQAIRLFGCLAPLVDYWARPQPEVQVPRFTTQQVRSSSHRDLMMMATKSILKSREGSSDGSSINNGLFRSPYASAPNFPNVARDQQFGGQLQFKSPSLGPNHNCCGAATVDMSRNSCYCLKGFSNPGSLSSFNASMLLPTQMEEEHDEYAGETLGVDETDGASSSLLMQHLPSPLVTFRQDGGDMEETSMINDDAKYCYYDEV